ncbi:MAG: sigma-70 family RNA polymerase sigma factor [Planctomycetaceae bacterium]|nr:sigma-70 family RNA polymerase sigma factor [Planctomycetaceae bacterium]
MSSQDGAATTSGRSLDNGPVTSATLLERLKSWEDTAAWKTFVSSYGHLLERWSRRKLNNSADVEEVNQQVLWELARRLTVFHYDPRMSFRGWLRTLHQSRLLDYLKLEKRRTIREAGLAQIYLQKQGTHERSVSLDTTDEMPDKLCVSDEMRSATLISERVRARVSPRTWAVFHDIAIEGQSISETAQRHSMRYASAFAAYSRVCRQLRQEAAK